MSNNIRIKSALPKGISSDEKKEIRSGVDALAENIGKIVPEGTLLISVYEKKESFTPIVKVAKDLMDLEFIYNFNSIQRDPSLLSEWTEILDNIKNIEKLVGKRKKKRNESFRKKRENKED